VVGNAGARSSSFADLLRRQRESAGLTQAELAVKAGLGQRTVSNLERGINRSPYLNTIRLLADALGLNEAARSQLIGAARVKDDSAGSVSSVGGFLGATPGGPLVARSAERTAIHDALSAAAGGNGRLVLLTGEPGIGKTRLAQEASRLADEYGFLVASGRCYETNSATPFAPLAEALTTLYAEAPSEVKARVEDRWPTLIPLLPDEFPIGVSAGVPVASGPDDRQLLFRAVSSFVREIARLRPVALLFDDLHWADGATLALLAHLARHNREHQRVLLLATYRSVGVERGHPVRTLTQSLSRDGLVDLLNVDRLDRDAVERLIAGRLDDTDVSDEFVALVHRFAQGNPFFTVEIVNALIERGDLSRIDGRWVRRELSDLDAPASISDAIGERVAHLTPSAQDVLPALSVLGEVVALEDLEVLDADEAELETALDEAVAAGLISPTGSRYTFEHVLIHHTLYNSLSPIRRRRLHRRAAEVLETRTGPVRRRRASEIARHYEAGGRPEKAVAHLLVAGDTAVEVFAQDEALQHYRLAAELAEEAGTTPQLGEAHDRMGRVLIMTGTYPAAIAQLLRAAEIYRVTGNFEARLHTEGMLAHAYHRGGNGDLAAVRLTDVIAELDEPGQRDRQDLGLAVLYTGLARVRLALREHQLALDAVERAVELGRRHSAAGVEAEAEAVRGTILVFLDQPQRAVDALERALSLASQLNRATVARDALLALQWASTMQGDLARAQSAGERGLEVTSLAGDNDAYAVHAANLGLTLFYRGDWIGADRHLVQSVELARAGSPTLFSGIPPAYLGLLRQGQGDHVAASALYAEAATAPDLRTFAFDAFLDTRLAQIDLHRGGASAALRRLEPWLTSDTDARPHDVMVWCAAAEACLVLGDTARGDALADRAVQRAELAHNQTDGIDALRIKARSLAGLGRLAEARSLLDRAAVAAAAIPYPAAATRVADELARLA
jgi:tetratricopeptide (TPR) repeat protein/transcriptional regulator with XRE-family HTH domain